MDDTPKILQNHKAVIFRYIASAIAGTQGSSVIGQIHRMI